MQHFLSLLDYTPEDIQELLNMAVFLKQEVKTGGNRKVLAGKTLGMIFQKPSLRTRVSFEMGMQHLGGHAIYLGPDEIGLGKRESIADVARVLGSYVQGIMARVFDHEHVLELARWSPVPVINGLSDYNHPCQALADALTIQEHYGHLEGIRLAYLGDSNNVTRSLLFMSAKMGMKMTIASPEGYQLDADSVQAARDLGAEIRLLQDPLEAVQDVDVIYTDTWVSMGQEEEAAQRQSVFPPYQVNAELLRQAPQHAVVMHDLPAYRGKEITDDVADGPQSLIFQQAENRLHAQKALLFDLLK